MCAVIDHHKPASPDGNDYAVFEPPVITGEAYVEPVDDHESSDFVERCIECGYDLRGSIESEVCPECGTNVVASVQAREFRRNRRAQLLMNLSGFRWIVYGAIPVLIWAPVALLAYRSGEPLLQWLILPSGITIGFGSTIFASVQVAEEANESGGLGTAFLVLLSLCAFNLGVVVFVLSKLSAW